MGGYSRSRSTSDLCKLDAVSHIRVSGGRRTSDTSLYDFSHPIKRSRSDQSLAGLAADDAGAAAGDDAGARQPQLIPRGGDACGAPPPLSPSGRAAGWLATLPVVMSDHGSSTNSLVSLESDATRSSASHLAPPLLLAGAQLLQAAPAPLGGAPRQPAAAAGAAAAAAAAALLQQQQPQQPHTRTPQGRISYLQSAGSAASLQHASLGRGNGSGSAGSDGRGGASPMLCRSGSDLSGTGNGGGGGGGGGARPEFFFPATGRFTPPPVMPASAPQPAAPAAPTAPVRAAALDPGAAFAASPQLPQWGGRGGAAAAGRAVTSSALDVGGCGGPTLGAARVCVSASTCAAPVAPPAPLGWAPAGLSGPHAFPAAAAFGAAAAPLAGEPVGGAAAWGAAAAGRGRGGVFSNVRQEGRVTAMEAFAPKGPVTSAALEPAPAAAAPARPQPFGPPAGAFAAPRRAEPEIQPADAQPQPAAPAPTVVFPHVPSAGQLPQVPSSGQLSDGADGWDFRRRAAAQRASAKGSGSSSMGRRRSSIEATMPWRAKLEETIAAAAGGGGGGGAGGEGEGAGAGGECEPPPGGGDLYVPGAALSPSSVAERPGQRSSADSDGPPPFSASAARLSGDSGSAGARERGASSSGSDAPASRGSGEDSQSPRGGGPRLGKARHHSGSSCGSSGYYSRQNAGGAALELFVRLNRARQTLDFAKRQANEFAELDIAEMGVWEALDALSELREYEAGLAPAAEGLDPCMSLKEHALQVAELCRLAFPDKEWLALVGLLHGLGKLLAHPTFGSQPQWAVAGETYPLGCRFAPQVGHAEFFAANPDRRRRGFSTADGVYQAGCGLKEVYMSWGAPEYVYLVMVLNQVALPEEALFILRYQKFYSLTRPGGAYRNLLSPGDAALVPLLSAFQRLSVYRRVELPPEALTGRALYDYYDRLIAKYIGAERLFW